MDKLLSQFKEQYGNVYAAYIKDETFVFRELTRKEHRTIAFTLFANQYEIDEAICSMAVLYPEEYDFAGKGKAGIAHTLSQQIIAASGYAHPSQQGELLIQYTEELEQFEMQAETYIAYAFPNIRFEEMENWTQATLMKYLARAEWIMHEIHHRPKRFNLITAEEKAAEEPEQEPPTLQELGKEMREAGLDPMLQMASLIHTKPSYTELPMIGGTKLLENEEGLANVRQQIQRVSEQRKISSAIPEE